MPQQARSDRGERPGRTLAQLHNEARSSRGIKQRSKMTKSQLENAVGR